MALLARFNRAILAPMVEAAQSPKASPTQTREDRRQPETTARRQFMSNLAALAGVAGLAGSCRTKEASVRPEPGSPPTQVPAPGSNKLRPEQIERAAEVMGVEYSTEERALMVGQIEENLGRIASTRSRTLDNQLAPATVFDPRLPGFQNPTGPETLRPAAATGKSPGTDEDIAFAPVSQLAEWLSTKKITSQRLTEIYLARLERLGPKLECLIATTPEIARAQARQADDELARGRRRSPLHGIPWGAKDLIDVAGTPTTWGAEPYRERRAETDAAIVRKLNHAGAVLVAKLTSGALAYGDIWYGGKTRNPWNTSEGSSGSSAGPAAATAAGLVGFAIGTETYGSIVSPCMRCGATGLRPTFGRVARSGAMALCWSLDKLGPITRSVQDCALVLAAVHGADAADAASVSLPFAYDADEPIDGLRVGYVPKWFEGEDSREPERAALSAARALGVKLVEVEIPDHPYDALLTVLLAEAAAAFEHLTLSGDDDRLRWQEEDAWPNTFRAARFVSAIDYVQAQRLRREIMVDFDQLFSKVDCIIGPSYAGSMLLATNNTGHPSLTLRAGFIQRKPAAGWGVAEVKDDTPKFEAPLGVTLWGKLYEEGTILRLGAAIEAKLGVAGRRPPVGIG